MTSECQSQEDAFRTAAGFPNPHVTRNLPITSGPPLILGPAGYVEPTRQTAALSSPDVSISENSLNVSSKQESTDPQSEEKVTADAKQKTDEDTVEESEEDEASTAEGKTLEEWLAEVTPAAQRFSVSMAQSTERQRVLEFAGKWTDIKGLQLVIRPTNEDDCILLFANIISMPQIDQQESQWVIRNGDHDLAPRFATYSRQQNLSHYICMAYLHQPGRRGEQTYQIAASLGSTGTSCLVSADRQRRQFGAITIPSHQCLWVEDDEKQIIEAGLWQDIQGFAEVITTLPGEKVLILAAVRYCAHWASEMNRGRFTIVRDDFGLDTSADRGLQSIRALAPQLKRTALIATIDEPPPGPHLYRVRAALSVGEEQGAVNVIEGERHLAIVRLPGHIVAGPGRVQGPVDICEESWMEIPGLSATITLSRPRDKVLVVYHADCHPTDFHYEAHFTVFRRGETGSIKNLGFSDDFGMEMVTSDYRCSSEYPVGIFCDVPGGLGPWTYYLAARVANMGTSSSSPPIRTGYAGSISAVLLGAR